MTDNTVLTLQGVDLNGVPVPPQREPPSGY